MDRVREALLGHVPLFELHARAGGAGGHAAAGLLAALSSCSPTVRDGPQVGRAMEQRVELIAAATAQGEWGKAAGQLSILRAYLRDSRGESHEANARPPALPTLTDCP